MKRKPYGKRGRQARRIVKIERLYKGKRKAKCTKQ